MKIASIGQRKWHISRYGLVGLVYLLHTSKTLIHKSKYFLKMIVRVYSDQPNISMGLGYIIIRIH